MSSDINVPPPSIDLRAAMRSWATGVSIVSTFWDNQYHGMTVNSFTSVSIDPPLITVSLERSTRTYQMLQHSRIFGVTILSASQQELSDRFAGRISDDQDRFSGLETKTLVTGAPFIQGGLAYIDCRTKSIVEVGPNNLILAEVVAVKAGLGDATADPLLYYSRAYRHLKPSRAE